MEEKKDDKLSVDDLDFEFFPEEGASILSTDQLKEINKKLPKWDIVPPDKYDR